MLTFRVQWNYVEAEGYVAQRKIGEYLAIQIWSLDMVKVM